MGRNDHAGTGTGAGFLIEARLGRKPLWCGDTGPRWSSASAWRTVKFIDSAACFGVDAFITGEVSEQTIHSAREQGLHF